jgi:hypothetical protein
MLGSTKEDGDPMVDSAKFFNMIPAGTNKN